MLARDQIMAVLTLDGALPADIDVIAYARDIDPPLVPTVMVRIEKVRPSSAAGGMWSVDAVLLLIEPQSTPGAADDALDGLLQDVLVALDTQAVANALTWTEANRVAYSPTLGDPTNPAYEVAVNTTITKE